MNPGAVEAGKTDPRTTRRRVPYARYNRDSALYATYRVIGYEGKGVNPDSPEYVVLEKKPEFIPLPRHRAGTSEASAS